jgi:hypothetical protein
MAINQSSSCLGFVVPYICASMDFCSECTSYKVALQLVIEFQGANVPPCAIVTRFASVTLKWPYTGLDQILPSYMHPLYESRTLQIWLLGTCFLLGPQGHVQEGSENFRFSGVTSMQVSMG